MQLLNRSLFEKCIQENFIDNEPCVLLKKKNEKQNNLNSEHFFELVTLEINATWRML